MQCSLFRIGLLNCMVSIRLCFLSLLLTCTTLYAQNEFNITGKVLDSADQSPMEAVSVFIPKTSEGTYTDSDGFFSITTRSPLPITLQFSYVGYQTKTLEITRPDQLMDMVIDLSPQGEQISEIVVQSNSMRERFSSTNTSVENIDARVAEVLPALFGEVDILKTLQLKPGITSGSEGSSSLFVRGGSGDQNLVLFDGVTIYNPSHLFGFFSTFNNDALSSVEVYKGGFPAEYGGRLSSVIDVSSKNPGKDKISGSGGVGLISSRLTLEGPIVEDKVHFLISGRRTYIDLFTEMVNRSKKDDPDFTRIPQYRFYDLNSKVSARLSNRDVLTVSGYLGADVFSFKSDLIAADFDWGNRAGSLNWNRSITERLFFNTSIFTANYRYNIINETGEFNFNLGSHIRDIGARWDMTYLHPKDHYIKGGVQWIQHKFKIGRFQAESTGDNIEFASGSNPQGQEFAAYLQDEFSIWNNFTLNLGIRYSGFLAEEQLYHSLEPRAALTTTLSDQFNLKTSYARMNQYIHLVANNGISLPTDIWFPTTDRVKPQISDQYVLGFNYLLSPSVMITNEYYYKKFQNQIELKDHAQIFINEDMESEFTFGSGEAYGTELSLEKKSGIWTGWIGYSLAWVQRGQFSDIENGAWFPPQFDRRHDLNVVSSFQFNDKWTVSATFVYGSGDKAWLPAGRFFLQDIDALGDFSIVPIYGKRNSITLPPYHRMDLSVVRSWKTNWGSHNLALSVYNLYDRRNPYFLYLDSEVANLEDVPRNLEIPIRVTAKQVSLFPILPSISWNFNF